MQCDFHFILFSTTKCFLVSQFVLIPHLSSTHAGGEVVVEEVVVIIMMLHVIDDDGERFFYTTLPNNISLHTYLMQSCVCGTLLC